MVENKFVPPPRFVLDTNVVLDWLVFRDAALAGWERALAAGRLELMTHQPALDELRRVLAYPRCKLESPEREVIFERYRARTIVAPLPASCTGSATGGFDYHDLMLPAGFPRCRDRDDEHFLALAYHVRATALVTKDKEVLRLRQRAFKFGVAIISPAQWRLDEMAGEISGATSGEPTGKVAGPECDAGAPRSVL